MAKKATLTTITSTNNNAETLNSNFEALNNAIENQISRDGSTPNAMQADLDLNSNDITNADNGDFNNLTVGGVTLVPNDVTAIPDWEGAWATSTSYAVNDLVQESGNSYICLTAHTSGTFATDLSSAYWELFAQKGSSGAGSGDLLAANDLSDVDDADTALANLGGGSVGINIFKSAFSEPLRKDYIFCPEGNLSLYTGDMDSLTEEDAFRSVDSGVTNQPGGVSLPAHVLNFGLAESTDENCQVLFEDDGAMWIRRETGGVWGSWVEMPTTDAKVQALLSGSWTTGTSQATTSGTTVDFTSIPSDCDYIEVMVSGVSISSNQTLLVQLGDSGGIETTGYVSAGGRVDSNPVGSTTGLLFGQLQNTNDGLTGVGRLTKYDSSDLWMWDCGTAQQAIADHMFTGAGSKELSGTLDRLRLTVGGGSFDAGKVNIKYRTT